MNVESIKSRLKQYSKKHRKVHQFTIIRFFQERFLYRLSISAYKKYFLLKGGALVYVFGAESSRYTKDIDFLIRQLDAEQSNLSAIFKEISQIDGADGLVFDRNSIAIGTIQKEGQYKGIRIKITGKLGSINQQLQIDIGVGDYLTSGPQEIFYPIIIEELAQPILYGYSIETLIAEKFEAMISLGEYNSRLKDFYDVYYFLESSNLSILEKAIQNTFNRRKTPIVKNHPVFEEVFYEDTKRNNQWKIFLERNELKEIDFKEVHEKLISFLKPIYEKL
ncbi:MAG: nucleotidyl transferase AbiEii/AbiGii toxin family protein [Bacteroidota bacterium]